MEQCWFRKWPGQYRRSLDGGRSCLCQTFASKSPRVVVFEQVAAFASHPHRPEILKILRWAGFKIVFARTVDVSDVAPVHRLRYLLIAIRTEDTCTTEVSIQVWNPRTGIFPSSSDVILERFTDGIDVSLSEVVKDKSSKHDFLPPAKRRHVVNDPTKVFQSRLVSSAEKAPIFVSSYGSQHEFSEQQLRGKGLMNHFLKLDMNAPRHWHPLEIHFLHLAVGWEHDLCAPCSSCLGQRPQSPDWTL